MAIRALRLLLAVSIFPALFLLAGCGSRSIVCPLVPASGNCGCGGATSTACTAPQYLLADGTDGHVYLFPIDLSTGGALGTPTSVSSPSASLGMALMDNSLLYVSSFSPSGPGSVDAWSLNIGTGTLTSIPGSPYSIGPLSVTTGVATASTPQAVYVADAGTIDAFKADAAGALTPVAGSPFPSGTNLYLTVDPASHFLLTSDDDPPGSIGVFSIDASSGALTQVPGSPFAAVPTMMTSSQPGQIIVDSTGKFVYATINTGQVVGFSIDATSGILTPVPGSPFNGDMIPAGLATARNFLYLSANSHLLGYSIDPTTGSLTPLSGSPLAVHSLAMTTDLSGNHLYASTGLGMMVFTIDGATGALRQIGTTLPSPGATVLALVQ